MPKINHHCPATYIVPTGIVSDRPSRNQSTFSERGLALIYSSLSYHHYRLAGPHSPSSLLTMSDSIYPLFPICAFLAFVLVLIPLPWHLQSWNSGTCLFMFWVGLSALNFFINSIIWHNNVLDSAPIWCDICKSTPILHRFCAQKLLSHSHNRCSSGWDSSVFAMYQPPFVQDSFMPDCEPFLQSCTSLSCITIYPPI